MTSKVNLVTSGLRNVPTAFELPEGIEELKKYVCIVCLALFVPYINIKAFFIYIVRAILV